MNVHARDLPRRLSVARSVSRSPVPSHVATVAAAASLRCQHHSMSARFTLHGGPSRKLHSLWPSWLPISHGSRYNHTRITATARSTSANQEPPRVRDTALTSDPGPGAASEASQKQHHAGPEIASSPPLSAYIHIPFCRRRCHYCDFPIVTVGARDASVHARLRSKMENYVDQVVREIKASASSVPGSSSGGMSNSGMPEQSTSTNFSAPFTELTEGFPSICADDILSSSSSSSLPPLLPPLKTVHFGGGTPSLLPPDLLSRLVDTLRRTYGLASDAEICMEADPGTFDEARLRAWVEGSGVTRLSVGCQAFDEGLLQACGRSHSLEDVYAAVDAVKRVGIENWSLDLISGLPGQTLDSWRHSLSEVIRLGPSHVSVYDLQVEKGTAFARWYSPGASPLPPDHLSAEMYQEASTQLRAAGFAHYEVSNYAKPGYQSRHNRTYWANLPYLGFGLGAASYVARKRFVRPRTWDGYGEWVDKYEASAGVIDWPEDSREEELLDTVMLGLRLGEGLGMAELAARFGGEAAAAVGKALLQFVDTGLVEVVLVTNGLLQVMGADHARTLAKQLDVICAYKEGKVGAAMGGFEGREMTEAGGNEACWEGLRIRLSDPGGFLVSNDVISSVFEAIG